MTFNDKRSATSFLHLLEPDVIYALRVEFVVALAERTCLSLFLATNFDCARPAKDNLYHGSFM